MTDVRPAASPEDLTGLQQRLQHTFSDLRLLQLALTHRSFGADHNERLEFLGDSVLNLAVASLLYERLSDQPEGDLSRVRANLVKQDTLHQLAVVLGLPMLLKLGEGEARSGGHKRPSILADALEAVIGALYLDAGFDAASALVRRLFKDVDITPRMPAIGKDPKTELQEWLQGRRHQLPQYMVKRIEGAAHQQTFYVECITERPAFKVEGSGVTRRAAEQDAAAKIIAKIQAKGIA